MGLKRLHKELKMMEDYSSAICTARPVSSDDMYNWEATFPGPADTPYEGGLFRLSVIFPRDYPYRPPLVRFKTKVYHPNVSGCGFVCLDVLQECWSPSLSVPKVVLSVSSLLSDPYPWNPFDLEIGKMCVKDRKAYDATARSWTLKYASPDGRPQGTSTATVAAKPQARTEEVKPRKQGIFSGCFKWRKGSRNNTSRIACVL